MTDTKFSLLAALFLGALTFNVLAQDGQQVVLMDEPDIYWTMGKLTEGGDAVFAETGVDVGGAPLHAVLESEGNDLPTLVDSIVLTASDGAMMFDAEQGQSLFVPDSPFTNDTPDNLGVTNRTYELWFQPRNLPEAGEDNRQILFMEGGTTRGLTIYLDGTQEGDDPTEADLYVMTTNLAEVPWGGEAGPGATDPDFAVRTTIQKGETYHLVYVIDKPDDVREDLNGDLIGYLNGEEFGRVDDKVGLWFDHTDDSGIGARYVQTVFHDGVITDGGSRYFYDGIIDEFAVYDGKSLTAEQIQEHYLAGIGTEDPPLLSFTADAERLGSGESLTLSWEVNPFDTLTINNGVGDVSGNTADGKGSITVNPTESTTYVLSGSKGDLEQTRSVSVFVGPPIINTFEISGAPEIRVGGSTTLTWNADGETSITIEPDIGDVSGTSRIDVSPTSTTTYTITATSELGSTSAEVTVAVTTALLPDLGWSANDVDDLTVEWLPATNNTDNDGILWSGEGSLELGASNFANVGAWVNAPSLALTGNPLDSWQDGLGAAPTQANVSWELVFRPGDFDGLHTLFNTGGNGDGTAFVLEGSVLDFRFQDADSDDQRVIAAIDLAEIGNDGDFYHVVGVADVDTANTGTASIYVNGELRAEVTSAGTINDWDGGDLAELGTGNNIPGGNPFNPEPFTGDIALFNYYEGLLLSTDQVGNLFRDLAGDTSFRITDFNVTEGKQISLTWDSSPGKFYDVEGSTNLTTGSWLPLVRAVTAAPDPAVSTTVAADLPEDNSMYYVRVRQVGPPPLHETSFEDGMGEWTIGGEGSAWEFGAPTTGPGAANTGTNVAATGLAGDYLDGTAVQLRSPVIDPGETARVKLEFSYYLEASEGHGGQISILEADGTPIQNLERLYLGVQDDTADWTQETIRLPALEPARPFMVQFAFLSTVDGDPLNGTGWMIDDVRISK